jgi:hypothetical protein
MVSRTRTICHLESLVVTLTGTQRFAAQVPDRRARYKVRSPAHLAVQTGRAPPRNHHGSAPDSAMDSGVEARANDDETKLDALVNNEASELLAERGVGGITATQILVSWSHRAGAA